MKIIDKTSWFIVAETQDLRGNITFEDEKGVMFHPERRYVCSYYEGDVTIIPTEITGNWNIRLFEENQKTAVEVNIVNLKATHFDYGGRTKYDLPKLYQFQIKSTGNFEKQIADYLK